MLNCIYPFFVQYSALLLCIFKDYMYLYSKVSYKAQLYVIMYILCYIKLFNSDNVGVMLHNFARYSDKVYCAFSDFNHKLFVTNFKIIVIKNE